MANRGLRILTSFKAPRTEQDSAQASSGEDRFAFLLDVDRVALRDGSGRRRTVARLKAGFTLIEMLVVLAIIGLLVGLVAPRVFNQLAEAKVRTAHIQIESFKNALDLFFLDAGRYPTSNEGLEALITRPSNAPSWGGPYIKGTAVPKDPWNNPYLYRSPGQNGRPYDMISAGPGGKGDSGSQIASW